MINVHSESRNVSHNFHFSRNVSNGNWNMFSRRKTKGRVQPAAKEESVDRREREREQIARWISINNVYFTIMFSSPNPCRRIVKPRTSRGVRHTGAGEPVSRYRFTFYREFNNGQPGPVEQNALIMRHEIVPMKIKRGWLPTLDDVKQAQRPWTWNTR